MYVFLRLATDRGITFRDTPSIRLKNLEHISFLQRLRASRAVSTFLITRVLCGTTVYDESAQTSRVTLRVHAISPVLRTLFGAPVLGG